MGKPEEYAKEKYCFNSGGLRDNRYDNGADHYYQRALEAAK